MFGDLKDENVKRYVMYEAIAKMTDGQVITKTDDFRTCVAWADELLRSDGTCEITITQKGSGNETEHS